MRIRVVLALLKKEFLNIIRDKKSFIIMILLPLLMFPFMIGILSIIFTSFTSVDQVIEFGVNYEVTEEFKNFVDNYSEKYELKIIYDTNEGLKEKFLNEDISIYVIKDGGKYTLHYDENNTNNIGNISIVEKIYQDYREVYLNKKLAELNIDYEELKNTFNIEFEQESVTEMGSFVPSVISMVLVMIISSVCFSVAIDVTTSEKEKGTLETILSLPIKKSELITSKYITVFLLSTMAGFLTYISLFCTLFFASDILSMLGVLSIHINIEILAIYLISIILISLLFSGLLLSVTIFSKNLKEAQNSLYPLELFVTIISMLPMFGIKASLKLALIPFVNISLLFNNALSSVIDPTFVFLAFLSTIIYAIVLIMIISKLYNQEDVLFNSKALSYIKFRNGKSLTTCFSVISSILIALIVLVLGYYFSFMFINSSKYFLLAIMPLTIVLVVFIACILVRLDVINSFKLKGFRIKKIVIYLLIYISTYIISNYILTLTSNLFPNIIKNYEVFESVLTVDNFWLSILTVALLPAICEELLFRGVIFNAFNKKYGVLVASIISALIFGIYHMNWIQGINAFILGLSFAYIYYKSDSLFVPIIFHFINNLIATLMSYYDFNIFIPDYYHLYFIICSIGLLIVSIYICEKSQ